MSHIPIHGHSIKVCKEINDALHEQGGCKIAFAEEFSTWKSFMKR